MKSPLMHQLPLTRIKLALVSFVYWMIRPFLGRHRVIKRNGIFFNVDLSEAIDFSIFVAGNFQNHVFDFDWSAIGPQGIIFDVGANMGNMALRFAKLAPQGHVYAFEPTTYAFAKLKANLLLNPDLAKRIVPVQTFVSDATADEPHLTAYSSWKIDRSHQPAHPLHGGIKQSADGIPSITLDDFCRQRNINRIDLIKIDTEGHELRVMKGARETLRCFLPLVIFELGLYVLKEQQEKIEDYFDFLTSLGYVWVNLKSKRVVTLDNVYKEVPLRSTTDILAIPQPALASHQRGAAIGGSGKMQLTRDVLKRKSL